MAEEKERNRERETEKGAGGPHEDLKSRLDEIGARGEKERPNVSAKPQPGRRPPKWTEISTPPRIADMAVAARQMSTLLDAGIPLIQSLRVLSERSQHPHLRRVFEDVTARVERGENLSSALSAHPRVFSRLFVGVAKIGESAGILDRSMLRLAEVLEQRVSIRRQIGAALAYPTVAICVAIVILLIIFGIAIPKFSVIYEDIDVQLPTITQIILAVAHFVQGYYWLYLPLAVLLVVVCVFWSRTSSGHRIMDTVRLRAPILGKITRKIYTARASRTMANLLEAGIPLLETLSLTSGTSENHHVARALDRVRDSVERGGKMEPPLRESNIFPAVAVDMVAIGDEAGSLDFMLRKIAENYETEVESTLRGVSSIIEPVLIIFLGFVVLMIALGALLPYFSLVGVVGVE